MSCGRIFSISGEPDSFLNAAHDHDIELFGHFPAKSLFGKSI